MNEFNQLTKQQKYVESIRLADSLNPDDINKSIELLSSIQGYKDADKLLFFCEKRLKLIQEDKLEEAISMKLTINHKKVMSKQTKIALLSILVIVVLAIACVIAYASIDKTYEDAYDSFNDGYYTTARREFEKIKFYKDSEQLYEFCNDLLDNEIYSEISLIRNRKSAVECGFKFKFNYYQRGELLQVLYYDNTNIDSFDLFDINVKKEAYENFSLTFGDYWISNIDEREIEVNLSVSISTSEYSIIYNLNGGTLSPAPSSYTYFETKFIGKPEKTGYTFVGWIVNGEGDYVQTYRIKEGSIGDIELTAVWKKD